MALPHTLRLRMDCLKKDQIIAAELEIANVACGFWPQAEMMSRLHVYMQQLLESCWTLKPFSL